MTIATKTNRNEEAKIGSYHDVMRHQHLDRRGITPQIKGFGGVADSLAAENDWVLLIFARSQRLRTMAARGANRLQNELQRNCAYLPEINDVRNHRACHILRALCGRDYDAKSVGYITIDSAFEALAIASSRRRITTNPAPREKDRT